MKYVLFIFLVFLPRHSYAEMNEYQSDQMTEYYNEEMQVNPQYDISSFGVHFEEEEYREQEEEIEQSPDDETFISSDEEY